MVGLILEAWIKSNQIFGVVIFLLESLDSVDEHLMLMLTQDIDEWLCSIPEDLTLEGNIICHVWETFFVEIDEVIKRSLPNIQSWKTWQEIISNEEAEEDEVIDDSLYVKPHFHLALEMLVFQHEVLPKDWDMDKLKIVSSWDIDSLNSTLLGLCDYMLLTDDHKMRLMSEQRQHDKIGIRPIEAVTGVWIIVRLYLKVSDVVHHFVFSLSWNTWVRQDYSFALNQN